MTQLPRCHHNALPGSVLARFFNSLGCSDGGIYSVIGILWSTSSPTVLSIQTNAVSLNGEFYVSSIQFHAAALTPQMIAGIGSPDIGPAPATDTSRQPRLRQSEPVPAAGLPNLILIYPLPAIVERLDLAKPCPPSVNRDMKLHSTRPGRIGIPTRSCVSPKVIQGSGCLAGRGGGTTGAGGLNEGVTFAGWRSADLDAGLRASFGLPVLRSRTAEGGRVSVLGFSGKTVFRLHRISCFVRSLGRRDGHENPRRPPGTRRQT